MLDLGAIMVRDDGSRLENMRGKKREKIRCEFLMCKQPEIRRLAVCSFTGFSSPESSYSQRRKKVVAGRAAAA